jgi:hypothetical protein
LSIRFVHSLPWGALAAIVALTFAVSVRAQPDAAAPKADAPKADAPKADAPKADAPKKDGDATKAEGAEAADDGKEEPFVLDDDDDDDDEPAEPTRHENDPTPAEVQAQRKHERDQPRPPLPADVAEPEMPEWERRLEIGPDFALVIRPLADGLGESEISYEPAPAWGVHINWPVVKWVHFRPYFVHAIHDIDVPQGALTTDSSTSISADAVFGDVSVETFVFGAKLAPTLHFNDRVRAWVALGVGWGRFSYPDMTVTEPGGVAFTVRDRSGVFVEFPLGLGISVDIIERWLLVGYEITAAPVTGQSGDAYGTFQAVNADGQLRDVGPFGAMELSVVQTLGLSLIL